MIIIVCLKALNVHSHSNSQSFKGVLKQFHWRTAFFTGCQKIVFLSCYHFGWLCWVTLNLWKWAWHFSFQKCICNKPQVALPSSFQIELRQTSRDGAGEGELSTDNFHIKTLPKNLFKKIFSLPISAKKIGENFYFYISWMVLGHLLNFW